MTLAKAQFSIPVGEPNEVELDFSKKALKLVKTNPVARKAFVIV